jgi:hypothetical protein
MPSGSLTQRQFVAHKLRRRSASKQWNGPAMFAMSFASSSVYVKQRTFYLSQKINNNAARLADSRRTPLPEAALFFQLNRSECHAKNHLKAKPPCSQPKLRNYECRH